MSKSGNNKSQSHSARQSHAKELAALRQINAQQASQLEAWQERMAAAELLVANAKHALTFVQQECKANIAECRAEVEQAQAAYAGVLKENDKLLQNLATRFKELAVMAKLLREQQLVAQNLAEAEARNRELEDQNTKQAARLSQQDDELQKLAQHLAQFAASTQEVVEPSKSVMAFLKPWSGKERRNKDRRSIEQQASLLRTSGLFDEDWYRERYPDVAKANKDPVVHYLMYGAAEGRDPGPMFSTNEYCATYPDVAASNMNPLLHYIRFGGKEGRLIQCAI